MQELAAAREHYRDLLVGRHCASTVEAISRLSRDNRILTPLFVQRRAYENALAVTARVHAALVTASDRLLQDRALRRQIGLGAHVDELLDLDRDHAHHSIAARIDAFVGGDGTVRFLEYNSYPSGLPAEHEIGETFASLSIASEFARRYPFDWVDLKALAVRAVAADGYGRAAPPSIAILDGATPPDPTDPRWMPAVGPHTGLNVIVASASDFTFRNGRLFARDREVDLVELRGWDDIVGDSPEAIAPILEALRVGAARTTFGISRGLLCGYKSTFELLSSPEYEHLFDAETNRVLQMHVPWTRLLRDRKTTYGGRACDLLRFVADNRERLVIKPSGAGAGAGVVLGFESSDAEWQRAIKIARAVQCVVQERIEPGPPQTYCEIGPGGALTASSLYADFDPFVWNGERVEGAIARLAPSGRHNYACGAQIAPLWILQP